MKASKAVVTRDGWVKLDGRVVGGVARDESSANMRLWSFTADTRPGVAARWRNGYRTRAEALDGLLTQISLAGEVLS